MMIIIASKYLKGLVEIIRSKIFKTISMMIKITTRYLKGLVGIITSKILKKI